MTFTGEEIVAILSSFTSRKMEIESLKNNPFVGEDHMALMMRDLEVMASVESKLLTVDI